MAETLSESRHQDHDNFNNNTRRNIANDARENFLSSILSKGFADFQIENFKSYRFISGWLHRPVDASALGVFRILFGLAMLFDIVGERGGSQLDVRYGEPKHCHFPLIHGMPAASLPVMGCIYLSMWLGALGIMLGYHFRLSCCAFIAPYWYIFILNKPAWNNHSYLFGLVGSILLFSDASNYWSLDDYLNPICKPHIPYWNYFLIKFQFFILYMYAGLKKFSMEWLSGYAMSNLSSHWLFTPFRIFLTNEMIDLYIIHWFTAVFDFSIAFFMTNENSRLYATPFLILFHLMNSRLFSIGMFPWVCLAEMTLFFDFDWPRQFTFIKRLRIPKIFERQRQLVQRENMTLAPSQSEDVILTKSTSTTDLCNMGNFFSKNSCCRTALILLYCLVQLFLPYSHFITKGYNNWTNGLYGYSWDMMVHSYDTIMTSIKIVDNTNQQEHFLEPYAFTEYDRWTKYADMAKQYAECIRHNIVEDYNKDPEKSPLSSTNISIYFNIWCSMNGRFQQRTFDPRVDILTAPWSPFEKTPWSLPLLNELNYLRPKIKTIADEVLSWSTASDVICVADFPGLSLSNHIAQELTNITLTILEGNIRYKSDDDPESYFLTAGKSIALRSGENHEITTIGSKPACYVYSYVNRTLLELQENKIVDEVKPVEKPKLPLGKEFNEHLNNFKKFFQHVGNCILYIFYGVPIPLEVRDIP